METQEKEQLQEKYKELAKVDKVNGTWGVKRLTQEIEILESHSPRHSDEIKGNMTGNLDESHPGYNYTFQDCLVTKGLVQNGLRKSPDIHLSEWYHIYLMPKNGDPDHVKQRRGWKTTMSQESWRAFQGKKIKYTDKYREVTILHDPTK